MSRSRQSASNTPDDDRGRAHALRLQRFDQLQVLAHGTRGARSPALRAIGTRRPSTVRLSMPAAASSASSCGPAPWITIGVRPTCCRKASEDTSASRSSRSTAPPTLTTAKRAASSCEKRLRYCWISFALPMFDSRRTMVWRVCGSWMACVASGARQDAHDGVGVALAVARAPPTRRRCAPARCRRGRRRTRCSPARENSEASVQKSTALPIGRPSSSARSRAARRRSSACATSPAGSDGPRKVSS